MGVACSPVRAAGGALGGSRRDVAPPRTRSGRRRRHDGWRPRGTDVGQAQRAAQFPRAFAGLLTIAMPNLRRSTLRAIEGCRAAGSSEDREILVLQSGGPPHARRNPYVTQLLGSLPDSVRPLYF